MNERIEQAARMHRHAAAVTTAAVLALNDRLPAPRPDLVEQHDLTERLRAAAERLAPGWLGLSLDALPATTPLGGNRRPEFVRIGAGQPLDDATFPMLVPLLGRGHLTFSADARDHRVAGVMRSILLRLLATAPAGSLIVRTIDATESVFSVFAPLAEAGLMPPAVAERDGLRAVLAEAEHWCRPGYPESGSHRDRERKTRPRRRDRCMLLVIASLPSILDGGELARIAALARIGPAHGLHMIVAGWPGAALTSDTATEQLPLATPIKVKNPHVIVGNPPGARFSLGRNLNVPVFLDPDPPAELIDRVCQELGARFAQHGTVHLLDLLPDPDDGWWAESAAGGLSVTVGLAGDVPISLHFADLTPHWLIGGRSGGGKTAFLIDVLYGLATRYDPDELSLYLLDFKEGVSFSEFIPTPRDPSWLPHATAVGVESDRAYGLAVLRALDLEMARRAGIFKSAGVSRYVDLRNMGEVLPRIVCVIDEFQVLLSGTDRTAAEAVTLLESVARKGRSFGIHLILASQTVRGIEALYAKRDSIFGQFPVRVALPGGSDVLEPSNDAAATLQLGTAIVNTAGGLGGPRGASRAHEKLVRFPDPHADEQILSALRQRLWQARSAEGRAPIVFSGFAAHRLVDDPSFGTLHLDANRPRALLGRCVDVALSTASFRFDDSPGRHLAVLGPASEGGDVIEAAARSLAMQHDLGSVLFVLAPLIGAERERVTGLARDLADMGHRVETVDKVSTTGMLEHENAYLLVWGMDLAGSDPRALLREGPARGVHLLAWWRQLRRFTEEIGGSSGREDIAGLVFLNLPAPEISLLLGTSVEWEGRPGRALFHDRHTGETSVIVPYSAGLA